MSGRQKIVTPRGEAIDEFTLLKTLASVFNIAGDDKTVTRIEENGFTVTEEAEFSARDIGGLDMWMTVQLAFSALVKTERDHHQFSVFGQHATRDAGIGIGNWKYGQGNGYLNQVMVNLPYMPVILCDKLYCRTSACALVCERSRARYRSRLPLR